MLFNSLTFLVFFGVLLGLHQLPLGWRVKKFNLLIASYLFYAAWNPPFVALLWISTATDWVVGRRMALAENRTWRRALLLISLGVNLGLLGYFKYAAFVLENFVGLLARVGVEFHPAAPDIILPLGISFYTFQTLSYTISIYRRETKPAASLLDFALFVTFFPQLVAGPIVRAKDFIFQLEAPKRANARQLGWGLALMNLGIFEKVVISDTLLAPVADLVYAAPTAAGAIDAWIGTLAFTFQIFFDFSGYSACAIGAALCFGFVLPENFRFPYASLGFSDFWRRWHISLSTWLRDYLYISLGGNRRTTLRTYINLSITMLLGGLWHGASWNFVIWGGLHGIYLAAERAGRAIFAEAAFTRGGLFQLAARAGTFLLVAITWVFFRASDLESALQMLATMASTVPSRLLVADQVSTVVVVSISTLIAHFALRETDLERVFDRLPASLKGPVLALPLLSLFLVPGDDRAFIYFRF